MAAKRLARNILVDIRLGGPDDGSPNWAGSPLPVAALLRDFSVEQTSETVDTSGLADATALIRFAGGARFTARGTLTVNANMYPLLDANGPLIGNYLEIQVKPDSSAANPNVWQGVISRWELRAQRNDIQEIQFEMQGPIDV